VNRFRIGVEKSGSHPLGQSAPLLQYSDVKKRPVLLSLLKHNITANAPVSLVERNSKAQTQITIIFRETSLAEIISSVYTYYALDMIITLISGFFHLFSHEIKIKK